MTEVVSYSELASYRRCPLKHQLEYTERWTKEVKPDSALAKGTLWHQVLETHYLTKQVIETDSNVRTARDAEQLEGIIIREAMAAVQPLLIDPRSGEQTEVQELIEWMYHGYLEYWGSDPNWKILGVEMRLQAPLPTGLPELPIDLKAKVDLVVYDRQRGSTWVVDHKSGKDLPREKELDIDDQFGLYTWLWNTLNPKNRVMGAIHNAARTYRLKTREMRGDERHSRTFMNRTDIELASIAMDAALTAVESRVGTTYSAPDSGRCKWDCSFVDPHLLARKGRDLREVLTEYGYEQNFERH